VRYASCPGANRSCCSPTECNCFESHLWPANLGLRGSESLDELTPTSQLALRRLIDRANRSGTVIYTMHATGLQTLQLDAQDSRTWVTAGASATEALNA
jgi:hypothetical protein